MKAETSERQFMKGTEGSAWEDLVISILSVNQYSLERTYGSLAGLRDQMLTDPKNLVSWGPQEFERRLKLAGCDRGVFMTALFAQRLAALGSFVKTRGIDECEKIIASRDAEAIKNLLLPVKGIGPVVLRNFYSLRQLQVS